jgi:hypothetical protein
VRFGLSLPLVALALSGCPGRNRPTAPPPEYEAPVVTPWDSAAPADPLEGIEGEEVTDDEPTGPPDAAPVPSAPPEDGGESDSGALPR